MFHPIHQPPLTAACAQFYPLHSVHTTHTHTAEHIGLHKQPCTHTHTHARLQYLHSIYTHVDLQIRTHPTHSYCTALLCNSQFWRLRYCYLCEKIQRWEINLVQQSMKVLSFPRVACSYGFSSQGLVHLYSIGSHAKINRVGFPRVWTLSLVSTPKWKCSFTVHCCLKPFFCVWWSVACWYRAPSWWMTPVVSFDSDTVTTEADGDPKHVRKH